MAQSLAPQAEQHPANAQAPAHASPFPGGPGPQTYAQQQARQAWATRKLALSPLRREWVTINRAGRKLVAMVTFPEGEAKGPVVMVGHEVFGLTDSTLNTAVEISQMGYITITPDFLSGYGPDGGGTASIPTDAGSISTSLDDREVAADINAWARYAAALPRYNGKLAIVGLSWSGGAAFRYVVGPDADPAVKAVFVLYDVGPPTTRQGQFHTTPAPGTVPVRNTTTPVFGFYPERDARVIDALPSTIEAMAKAHIRFDVVIYKGADHAFMRVGEDPADPNPANIEALKASLARIQQELGKL